LSSNYSVMLIPDGGGRVRNLRFSRRTVYSATLLLLLAVAFGLWGVWSLYQSYGREHQLAALKQHLVANRMQYQQQVEHLKHQLNVGRRKVAVVSRNIGNMQARLARLDALGSKLVEAASLDASEFNFGQQPAFGGPRIVPSTSMQVGEMDVSLQALDSRLANVDAQLAAIDYLLEQKRNKHAALPHAWPTEGGWLSSPFGMRRDPFTGEPERHPGVDIANRFGAPVLAASRGVVIFAGKTRGYGNMIEIDHGYGYITRYGHMSKLVAHVGEVVEDNQVIGRVGSTGRSTGPHLHYEVHHFGHLVDPGKFLPRG